MRGFNECFNCGQYFDVLSGGRLDLCPACEMEDEDDGMIHEDTTVYLEPNYLSLPLEEANTDDFESEDYMDYSIYGNTFDTYDLDN
jgi:hypothetical protein